MPVVNKRINGTLRRVFIDRNGKWRFLKGKPKKKVSRPLRRVKRRSTRRKTKSLNTRSSKRRSMAKGGKSKTTRLIQEGIGAGLKGFASGQIRRIFPNAFGQTSDDILAGGLAFGLDALMKPTGFLGGMLDGIKVSAIGGFVEEISSRVNLGFGGGNGQTATQNNGMVIVG